MKKFFKKLQDKANSLAIKAKCAVESTKGEGYIDTGVKIIIGVVVGAVILAGLYALFDNIILPRLNTEITNMFNYTDGVSPAAITNETKLSEARTLVVKNKSELPTGKTIISIEKTATNGLVDTYTVTYDDGSTYEFTVTNGEAGQPGENGNNGKTPTFKIETGELKVSYDTWFERHHKCERSHRIFGASSLRTCRP